MANNTFYLKKGDTFPNMVVQLLDENSVPINLTNTIVLCRISQPGSGNLLIEREATVLSQTTPNLGKCYFTFQAGDTDVVGTYKVEWKVTFQNGQIATFPRGATDTFNSLVIQAIVD